MDDREYFKRLFKTIQPKLTFPNDRRALNAWSVYEPSFFTQILDSEKNRNIYAEAFSFADKSTAVSAKDKEKAKFLGELDKEKVASESVKAQEVAEPEKEKVSAEPAKANVPDVQEPANSSDVQEQAKDEHAPADDVPEKANDICDEPPNTNDAGEPEKVKFEGHPVEETEVILNTAPSLKQLVLQFLLDGYKGGPFNENVTLTDLVWIGEQLNVNMPVEDVIELDVSLHFVNCLNK